MNHSPRPCSTLSSPRGPSVADLLRGELRPECKHVPTQVPREPLSKLETRNTESALEPDGWNLSDWPSHPSRLCHQLEPHFKSGVGLDPHFLNEGAVVGLERVRGIA